MYSFKKTVFRFLFCCYYIFAKIGFSRATLYCMYTTTDEPNRYYNMYIAILQPNERAMGTGWLGIALYVKSSFQYTTIVV